MDTRPYTCCFTGHQNLPIHQQEEIWQRVCTRLYPLLERDVRYFGVGGAIGYIKPLPLDLIGEMAVWCRNQYGD